MVPFALVAPGIEYKCGRQVALVALIANFATRWRFLHQLQICPSGGASCMSCKSGHQVAPLALVSNLVTRGHHFHKSQI